VFERTLCLIEDVHCLGEQLTTLLLARKVDRRLRHAAVFFESADQQSVIHL
jgi:hypothetical protein